jgi:hypothetical protein
MVICQGLDIFAEITPWYEIVYLFAKCRMLRLYYDFVTTGRQNQVYFEKIVIFCIAFFPDLILH